MKDCRISEIILSEKQIKKGIKRAAKWINSEFKDKQPIIIGILKGCIPFYGKIIPQLTIDCYTEFMAVYSFHGGTQASTEPEIKLDISTEIQGKDLIILEDIIDTARTLSKIKNRLLENGAKSVTIVTLLDKPTGRKVDLKADYSCFKIPDKFLVGFGLDYKELFRNLPYVGVLKPEFIEKGE